MFIMRSGLWLLITTDELGLWLKHEKHDLHSVGYQPMPLSASVKAAVNRDFSMYPPHGVVRSVSTTWWPIASSCNRLWARPAHCSLRAKPLKAADTANFAESGGQQEKRHRKEKEKWVNHSAPTFYTCSKNPIIPSRQESSRRNEELDQPDTQAIPPGSLKAANSKPHAH